MTPIINRITVVPSSFSNNISIFEGQTIGALQKSFTDFYPFLKIDFFNNIDLNGIRVNRRLDSGYALFGPTASDICLSGSKTIRSLKEEFKSVTGLLVKIFRKSGNVWIETSLTDDWTLERQNEEGKSMTH